MTEYFVQTGNLKITILAETAFDAAVEAVQCWNVVEPTAQDADHRRNLEPTTVVRRDPHSGRERRYPTFNLLAFTRNESPATAWQRLLSEKMAVN